MKRRIERPLDEYSLHALVHELRVEARANWVVMHEFRKEARVAITESDRCARERMALDCRQRLIATLTVLNAGLCRSGSYRSTWLRRMERERAEWEARQVVAA